MRIILIANTSWYLFNFRSTLSKRLQEQGHEVITVAPRDNYSYQLQSISNHYVEWKVSRYGINPLKEAASLLQLILLIKKLRPKYLLSFTHKGNLYGGISSVINNCYFICNISGLGRLFISHNIGSVLIRRIYLLLLQKAKMVFFQNSNDQRIILGKNQTRNIQSDLLPGSGVDLNRFKPEPDFPVSYDFILIARLLKEKGIYEYAEAATIVHQTYPNAKFALLGFLEEENKAGISKKQIISWESKNILSYFGETSDVRPFIRKSKCVVLPSYYMEGIPRTLLEAGAMGKPIITTDHPGCKEAIEPDVTGLLCLPKDAQSLADKMIQLLSMSKRQQLKMGQQARLRAEQLFDENLVLDRYLALLNPSL